jgi:flavin reductase (DIM6/NTAB) family NADH-FMN oxidoreductase RutF
MKPAISLPQIPIHSLKVNAHSLFDRQWFLLSAGDFAAGEFNTMTISWGALGTIWNKPLAMVAVRPSRYTYQFMERFSSFTLSAFETRYRPALDLLGTRSGRDLDKIAAAGLTPAAVPGAAAPAFVEAKLVLVCEKMYWQDVSLEQMRDPSFYLNSNLPEAHRIYFGEVTAVYGQAEYLGGQA